MRRTIEKHDLKWLEERLCVSPESLIGLVTEETPADDRLRTMGALMLFFDAVLAQIISKHFAGQ